MPGFTNTLDLKNGLDWEPGENINKNWQRKIFHGHIIISCQYTIFFFCSFFGLEFTSCNTRFHFQKARNGHELIRNLYHMENVPSYGVQGKLLKNNKVAFGSIVGFS